MTDDRKRLSGMLNFAAGILASREQVRFGMSEGGGIVLREEAIAGSPGIVLGGEDSWMRLARMRENPPPLLPERFIDWLDGSTSDPVREPRLEAELVVEVSIEAASDLVEAGLAAADACHDLQEPDPETGDVRTSETRVRVRLKLDDLAEFQADFGEWLRSAWTPWAEAEAPRRRSIRIYQSLFKLHAMMQGGAGGTAYELVWGIGIARWKTAGPQPLDLPVIEQLVDIELEKGGDLVVRPRIPKPQLVMAPYIALEVAQAHQTQVALEPMLAARIEDPDLELTPFDAFSYEDILQTAAARLTGTARLVTRAELAEGAQVEAPGKDLAIYGSWAVYARPRSENVRREDLQEMARKIERTGSDDAIPEPLRGFVRHLRVPEGADAAADGLDFAPDFFAGSASANAGWDASPAGSAAAGIAPGSGKSRRRDPYFFPLPYNDEQGRIINTLEEGGVAVVAGPPGTGKSHTIANIISHYMATNRRVLVTAKTPEAISVIQEKLPEALCRLTIAVVHSDREGAKQLEDAVAAIADDARAVDPEEMRESIAELQARIGDTDTAMARIDRTLGEIARANLQPIPHAGRELMPMDLAEELVAGRGRHGWFADRPAPGSLERLDEGLVEELRELRADLGADLVYLDHATLPRAEDLPGAQTLIEANAVAAEAHGRLEEDFTGAPTMVRDDASAETRARALAAGLAELDGWLDGCEEWLKGLYRAEVAILLPGADTETARLAAPRTAASRLSQFLAETEAMKPVSCSWPENVPNEAEFWHAAGELARGRQPIGFLAGLFKRDLKAALAAVRIAGEPASLAADWQSLIETRRWRAVYARFRDEWAGFAVPDLPALPDLPAMDAGPAGICEALVGIHEQMRDARNHAAEAAPLAEDARTLFLYGLEIDPAFRRADHTRLRWALRANLAEDTTRHSAFDVLERAAQGGTTPVHDLLADLCRELDGARCDPAAIIEARGALAAELARLQEHYPALDRIGALLAALAEAGAPAWAAALADPDTPGEDEPDAAIPDDWCKSWAWGEAMGRIEAIHGLQDAEALRAEKAALLCGRRGLFEEVIVSRTLLALNRRIGRVHSALTNFTQAIRKLGRGTGKEAPRWRAEIRRAALAASPAVPVWIMPEHRVAEQLPKEVGDFDLVILDEASQSDITALGALARGARLLIVGDDEQVSPTSIGVTTEKIAELRTRYLTGLEDRNMIDAESSIFDVAQMMFPDAQVMLREHFRSVAPIIAFSSRFYQGGLIPLRIPKPSERLDPPLIDIYLPEGRRESRRNVNHDEAAAIVEEIAVIVADPAMAGRSIGVISLIGSHQAEAIERALMEHPEIGPEQIQRHRIICGDSSTLQGQERDIVFLSMVTDRSHVRTARDRKTAQRFNVAMSRARDRLYLARSVARSHLAPADLKHQVIAHFHAPLPDGVKVVDVSLIDRCQSGFEREVCARLLDSGYRVIPQMRAGAFSIDLVVEGPEDRRLAIELDGDRYHGPERWEADMARQAALERAGWVFWRVFGSQWKADPDLWWRRLVARLDDLGIPPIGSVAVNEIYTEHRVIRGGEATRVSAEEVEVAALEDADASEEAAPLSLLEEAAPGVSQEIAAKGSIPARAAAGSQPTEQGALPGFGDDAAGSADTRAGADETEFHIEEARPEIVAPGMRVALRYPEGEKRRTILISLNEHAPDSNVIHVDRPLAQALIGASVEETVEFDQDGRTIRIVVESIEPELWAAE